MTPFISYKKHRREYLTNVCSLAYIQRAFVLRCKIMGMFLISY